MTYRNKLLLKRLAIIVVILVVAIALALLIGFSYLGRYVVYTEDGAYFDFNAAEHVEDENELEILPPDSAVLVMGQSIFEPDALVDENIIRLADDEVNGLLVDYDTLKDGSTLNAIELTENNYNMLVLEMRSGGSDILQTEPVITLIDRAKNQNIKLVAMMSCLNDIPYAEAHGKQALLVSGGDRYLTPGGSYWLDPTQEEVRSYLLEKINTLIDMGFQEVILRHFSIPDSTSLTIYSSEKSYDEMLTEAYEALEEAVGIKCTLSLLITDPTTGHQAYDAAEHLYVYYHDGAMLEDYKASHPDYYIVFMTASRDTRFDNYGKVMVTNNEAAFIPAPVEETTEESPEE